MMELQETMPEQSGCCYGSYTGGKRSQRNAWKQTVACVRRQHRISPDIWYSEKGAEVKGESSHSFG